MQLRDRGSEDPSSPHPTTTKLRPYHSPVLVEYGQVSKLTQGGGFTLVDGIHSTKMCL
jgi:hypothetical protein